MELKQIPAEKRAKRPTQSSWKGRKTRSDNASKNWRTSKTSLETSDWCASKLTHPVWPPTLEIVLDVRTRQKLTRVNNWRVACVATPLPFHHISVCSCESMQSTACYETEEMSDQMRTAVAKSSPKELVPATQRRNGPVKQLLMFHGIFIETHSLWLDVCRLTGILTLALRLQFQYINFPANSPGRCCSLYWNSHLLFCFQGTHSLYLDNNLLWDVCGAAREEFSRGSEVCCCTTKAVQAWAWQNRIF